jgi:hypothetical protein
MSVLRPPHSHELHDLPTEILQLIGSFLPLSSAALLTLTCHTILSKLNTTYLTPLKASLPPSQYRDPHGSLIIFPRATHGGELEAFLILLSLDLPDHIYCYFCRLIHLSAYLSSNQPDSSHACTRIKPKYLYYRSIPTSLTFPLLNSVSKRSSRFNISPTTALQPLTQTRTLFRPTFTRQISTLAKHTNNAILLRSTHWLLIAISGPLSVLQFPHLFRAELCPHIQLLEFLLNTFKSRVFSSSGPLDTTPTPTDRVTNSGLFQCKHCATEFEIDSATTRSRHEFALRVTVWQDFGACESPWDPMWEDHFVKQDHQIREPIPRTGSIKDAFEGACEVRERLRDPEIPEGLRLRGRWEWLWFGKGDSWS